MKSSGNPQWSIVEQQVTAAEKMKSLQINLLSQLLILISLLIGYDFAEANLFWSTTGVLEGMVVDKSTLRPLVGVNISIIGTTVGTISSSDGHFQISNLRAAVYNIRLSLVGYSVLIVKDVTILPDLRTKLNVELEPAAIALETVEIFAEHPLIQIDQGGTAFSVGEIKLEALPVSKLQDVLSLQPGTTYEGNVRGGKTNEVLYLIDGLPIQDVIGGGLGTSLPKGAITGMTIHTGGYEAEYGNALSGVVNVITKGGGSSYLFGARIERDGWLSTNVNKQQDRLTEIELSASGPLLSDELYFFSANNFQLTDTRWWQDFKHFFDSPIVTDFSGFEKVEYIPTPIVRLTLQGIYSLQQWHDYEFSWRFNLNGLPKRSRDSYRAAMILSYTFSENAFLTVHLSRFYSISNIGDGSKNGLGLQPYEYDFFLRYIIGGKRNWWAETKQVTYTVKADYTSQLTTAQLFKTGIELNQFNLSSDLVKYEPQVTFFGKPILDAPLLGYSNSYEYYPRSGSVYIQDKFEIVDDRSTFTAGIRWDFLDPRAERPVVEFIPTRPNEFEEHITGKTKAKFKHQLSPRLSFTAPTGVGSIIFVNFGHYFQFPLFDYLYSGINPAQIRSGVKNVLTGNPDLEPEKTIAWECGFKYEIQKNLVGSVTYFRKNFQNQIDSKTLIPNDSKAAGDFGFAMYVNNAEAEASGIEIVLDREQDERFNGSISYSYMVTEGLSEYADQTINYAQWGFPLATVPYPLSWDQRHTFKIDANFKLIGGVETNMNILYNSPHPYTYYPTRDGYTPSDPTVPFIPNNARMRNNIWCNLKFTREFRFSPGNALMLKLYIDIRNLFNTKNVRWMDSNGRVGGELSDPGAYYDPRRVRIGIRIEF
jgi:outer membrane receptor for ferrienterochelin and colicin